MSNEEILAEIDAAMKMSSETKSRVNEALCHARNIVKKDSGVDEEVYIKALNDGRNEVWEMARKLFGYSCDTKLTNEDLKKIFGSACEMDILRNFTPQEALAKLEEYEKANEIKVGDVVEHNGDTLFVVTRIDKMIIGYDKEGNTHSFCFPNQYIKKTGKHIDIQSMLQQIGK